MATSTLALLHEAAQLPAYAPLLRIVHSFVRTWQAHFWRQWRAPDASLLPGLIGDTFRADLAVERERARWREAAKLPSVAGRHVRTEWRQRIERLVVLDDAAKQWLAASLRAGGIMEADFSLSALFRMFEMPSRLDGKFRENFVGAFDSAMKRGANGAVSKLGIGADWKLADPRAVSSMTEYAGYYGHRITKLVPMEWQVKLKKAVIDGIDSGASAEDMGAQIKDVWTGLQTWEAERIARTEAVRARSEGTARGYEALGVQQIEWEVGGNPCSEICEPNAGRVFPIAMKGMIPAHPHCSCSWTAAEDDLNRMRSQALAGGVLAPLAAAPAPRYAQG